MPRPPDPKDVVRRGYDEISAAYRGDDPDLTGSRYLDWTARLVAALPRGARVLDLGCGNGVPVCRELAAAGLRVTGVDFSEVQIDRARRLVPDATFVQADMTQVEFPAASFDAVTAFYSLIHVPVGEQPALLCRLATWLVPGGQAMLTTGHQEWTGSERGWHGGTEMWWSHADAATYRRWLTAAGLVIATEEFVAEGDSGHALFTVMR